MTGPNHRVGGVEAAIAEFKDPLGLVPPAPKGHETEAAKLLPYALARDKVVVVRQTRKDPWLRFPAPDVVINDHNYWYRKTLRQYRQRVRDVEVGPGGCGFFC